jgi:hypothetical protein
MRSHIQDTVGDLPFAAILIFLVVVSSGCVHAEATAGFERLDGPTEVAESTSVDPDSLHPSVRTALSNGTSERTVQDSFLTDEFSEKENAVRYKGKYYRVSQRKVGNATAEELAVNITRTEEPPQYTIEELPESDRKPIETGIENMQDSDDNTIAVQSYVFEERNRSILLDENEIVVSYRGENYRVTIREHRTSQGPLYVYESSVVANSSTEYGDEILEKYTFSLKSPPEGSEKILTEAINSTYYGEKTEGFDSLKQRLMQEKGYILRENKGVWFVRYDGSLYKAKLRW